ncbi:MAG: outer membrane beta-barrel protein [Flavobacteriales bacterium]
MKKIITSLLLASTMVGFAQENAFQIPELSESFFVEGGINVKTSKVKHESNYSNYEETSDLTSYSFTPKVGYNFADNMAVGLHMTIGKDQAIEEDYFGSQTLVETKTLFFGPFLRYSPLTLGKRFRVFFDFGAGYGTIDRDEDDVDRSIAQFTIGTGINYFVHEHIAINGQLGNLVNYARAKADFEGGTSTQTNFDVNLNNFTNILNQASFGATFFL